jgi:hypothetical protein
MWCLRHRLHARASDQLLASIALDPGHPQISSLSSRLQAAEQRDLPIESQSSTEQAAATTDLSLAPLPDIKLSAAAMQQFTSSVQPLLMNRCAAGACHGLGSSSALQIIRPPARQAVTSRLTQRNLRAVLQFVRTDAPQASPLLVKPQHPHGGLNEAVLDIAASPQTETLREWILQLKSGPGARAALVKSREDDPNPQLKEADVSIPPPTTPLENTARDTAPVKEAMSDEAADPFDPEIFNRHHGLVGDES